ncbi:MAG TPA: hypothetical protein VKB38_09980 [Terracidiphilus sp.]|nr:hypothetical protein [Terracidiphilus sp.]
MSSNSLGFAGVCILVLLGGWLLVSVPNQFTNRLGAWVTRINAFGFIPKWTFFAPIPGTFNYHLIYRDLYQDGSAMPWLEVDWCTGRRWFHAVWHPRRLTTKLIIDSINGLGEVILHMTREGTDVERDPQSLILSTPYVLLLNLVMSMPRQDPCAISRQMAIFQQDPTVTCDAPLDSPRIGKLILCSSAHDFNRPQ